MVEVPWSFLCRGTTSPKNSSTVRRSCLKPCKRGAQANHPFQPLNSFIASAECVWAVVRSLGLMDKMLDGMLAISQNQIRSAISLQEETTARDVPVGMDHTRLHLIDRLEVGNLFFL